jgi:hypothetical protein
MKFTFLPFRLAVSLLVSAVFFTYSAAQDNYVPFDQLKIFKFYKGYYANVIDTAGNILFEDGWDIIRRLEECEKFLGIKILQDASGSEVSYYKGAPAEIALLSPDGTSKILPFKEVRSYHMGRLAVLTEGGWGIVDCNLNWIHPPVFEEAPWLADNHILVLRPRSDTVSGRDQFPGQYVGLANYSGEMLAPAVYSMIHGLDWWEEPCYILMKENLSSLVDHTGRELIPPGEFLIYPSLTDESVWVISSAEAKVYYPGKDLWITENLEEITRGLYGEETGLKLQVNMKDYHAATWVNQDQSVRIDASPYTVRMSFRHPYLRVQEDGKFGVVSKSGKIILPCLYDNIYQEYPRDIYEHDLWQCVFEGIASVELNGTWGLVDTTGNYRTHIIYDALQGASEGIVAAEVKGQTGFIDVQGKKIIPFVFDWTDQPWKNGIGTAHLGESEMLVNRQGIIITSELGSDGPASVSDLKRREVLDPVKEELEYLMEVSGGALEEETWLEMENGGLTSIPDFIDRLTNIKELYLRNNYISHIGSDLAECRKLEVVHLSNNSIVELSSEFIDLHSINKLYLNNNLIRELPAGIFSHPGITELDLAENSIEVLPEVMSSNKTLEKLDLANNRIKTLPHTFASLRGLVNLDLANNRISELPDGIGQLQKLEYIDLGGNRLERMPRDLSELKSLRTIHLPHNRLTTFPEGLLDLKNLVRINLEGNPIPDEELNRIMEMRPDLYIDY